MSYSKVRSLTRIATPSNETELLNQTAALSAANVEAFCRQRLNAKKAASAGANQAHAKRSLRLWQCSDTGMLNVSLDLSIEEGKLFEKAIEKAAERLSEEVR